MDRDRRIGELLSADPMASRLGIRLLGTDPVTVEMAITPDHHNFYDTTHGGAMYALAECAMGLAAEADVLAPLTIDTHLALTASTAAPDVLTATVEEVTRGRMLATYRVRVVRGDGRIAAVLTGVVHQMAAPTDG